MAEEWGESGAERRQYVRGSERTGEGKLQWSLDVLYKIEINKNF